MLTLAAMPIAMLNTALTPLLISAAPREFMGRVIAVFGPVTQLATMVATVLAGWLAGTALRNTAGSLAGVHFGPVDTVLAGAGFLIVLAGLYGRAALPQLAAESRAQPGTGEQVAA